MRVYDFDGLVEVSNIRELEKALMKRYLKDGEEVNHFWLDHDEAYPSLAIPIRGNLAGLHYFPEEGHPGFRSEGNMKGLKMGKTTEFYMNIHGQSIDVINDAIVPVSVALRVAKEFFYSKELPKSVEWFEL